MEKNSNVAFFFQIGRHYWSDSLLVSRYLLQFSAVKINNLFGQMMVVTLTDLA